MCITYCMYMDWCVLSGDGDEWELESTGARAEPKCPVPMPIMPTEPDLVHVVTFTSTSQVSFNPINLAVALVHAYFYPQAMFIVAVRLPPIPSSSNQVSRLETLVQGVQLHHWLL
jgi:hypothetical protein